MLRLGEGLRFSTQSCWLWLGYRGLADVLYQEEKQKKHYFELKADEE